MKSVQDFSLSSLMAQVKDMHIKLPLGVSVSGIWPKMD